MIREYGIDGDNESFRQITVGAQTYKRYSKRALDALRSKLATVEACWQKQRLSLSGRKKAKG